MDRQNGRRNSAVTLPLLDLSSFSPAPHVAAPPSTPSISQAFTASIPSSPISGAQLVPNGANLQLERSSTSSLPLPPLRVRFVSPIPEELRCPICLDLLRNAVFVRECGHTFCKACIVRCCTSSHQSASSSSGLSNSRCPTCRADILDDPCRNHLAAALLDAMQVRCRYGMKPEGEGWSVDEKGCQVVLAVSDVAAHERVCGFAPSCCVHRRYGCNAVGSRNEMEEHEKSCPFSQMSLYIQAVEAELCELKSTVKEQALEIDELRRILFRTLSILENPSSQASGIAALRTSIIPAEIDVPDGPPPKPSLEMAIENVRLRCASALSGHTDTVEALTVWRGTTVLSGSWDGTIREWSLEDSSCARVLKAENDVRALEVSGDILYCGCSAGYIQKWDLINGVCLRTQDAHSDDVLALSLVGKRLFSASSDCTVKVWDEDSLEYVHTLAGHANWVFALQVYKDRLFSGSSDCSIKVWDVHSFDELATLTKHTDQVRSLLVSGNVLFSGSYDHSIIVWNADSLDMVCRIDVAHEVFGLGIVGPYLVSGDDGGSVDIWDTNNGFVKRCSSVSHKGSVYAILQCNEKLLTCSSDTSIRVWEGHE